MSNNSILAPEGRKFGEIFTHNSGFIAVELNGDIEIYDAHSTKKMTRLSSIFSEVDEPRGSWRLFQMYYKEETRKFCAIYINPHSNIRWHQTLCVKWYVDASKDNSELIPYQKKIDLGIPLDNNGILFEHGLDFIYTNPSAQLSKKIIFTNHSSPDSETPRLETNGIYNVLFPNYQLDECNDTTEVRNQRITFMAENRAGSLLAVARKSGKVEVQKKEDCGSLKKKCSVNCVTSSQNAHIKHVAVGNDHFACILDDMIIIWDTNGKRVLIREHETHCFVTGANFFVVTDNFQIFKISYNGNIVQRFERPKHVQNLELIDLKLSPNENMLLGLHQNGNLTIWNTIKLNVEDQLSIGNEIISENKERIFLSDIHKDQVYFSSNSSIVAMNQQRNRIHHIQKTSHKIPITTKVVVKKPLQEPR